MTGFSERPVHSCADALCPCYLAGLRAGVKPTGPSLLGALAELFPHRFIDEAPPDDGSAP